MQLYFGCEVEYDPVHCASAITEENVEEFVAIASRAAPIRVTQNIIRTGSLDEMKR